MPPLVDARAKLDRARLHIAELESQNASFLETKPYDVTPEYYTEKDMTVYFLDRFTPVPVALPLIIGEAVHNLRSALDIAAWTAYRSDNTDEGRHIYFPIAKDATTYPYESERKLKGVKQSFKDAINTLEPYAGGNDLLFGLHKLDLADKHQLLITPLICVEKFGMKISTEYVEREFKGLLRFSDASAIPPQTLWFDAPTRPELPLVLSEGAPIFSVAGDREKHQDVELTFDIGLAEPYAFRNRAAGTTLLRIAEEVERIISMLEAKL